MVVLGTVQSVRNINRRPRSLTCGHYQIHWLFTSRDSPTTDTGEIKLMLLLNFLQSKLLLYSLNIVFLILLRVLENFLDFLLHSPIMKEAMVKLCNWLKIIPDFEIVKLLRCLLCLSSKKRGNIALHLSVGRLVGP